MIKTYSQRITPPFSGQVQIAESERARALTMDGKIWEFYFLFTVPGNGNSADRQYQRRFAPVLTMGKDKLDQLAAGTASEANDLDERILELVIFIASANLPFASADRYEYWLLDAQDESPLALLFSCVDEQQMEDFPKRAEWTALPSAVMRIEKTPEEIETNEPPVNYRVERMVADRAGFYPKSRWFKRQENDSDSFPELLLTEVWPDEIQVDLCQRYLNRQATRLLMLHHLKQSERERLERHCKNQVFETERFFNCYPQVIDEKLMKSILVEARLRGLNSQQETSVSHRRDGIHYL